MKALVDVIEGVFGIKLVFAEFAWSSGVRLRDVPVWGQERVDNATAEGRRHGECAGAGVRSVRVGDRGDQSIRDASRWQLVRERVQGGAPRVEGNPGIVILRCTVCDM